MTSNAFNISKVVEKVWPCVEEAVAREGNVVDVHNLKAETDDQATASQWIEYIELQDVMDLVTLKKEVDNKVWFRMTKKPLNQF